VKRELMETFSQMIAKLRKCASHGVWLVAEEAINVGDDATTFAFRGGNAALVALTMVLDQASQAPAYFWTFRGVRKGVLVAKRHLRNVQAGACVGSGFLADFAGHGASFHVGV
jgi:hypothetical protein